MKKRIIVIIGLLLISALALTGCGAAAQIQEYEMDDDTIPSINSVVGERTVVGVETSISNGVPSKQYTYSSTSVFDDVFAYIKVLVEQEGWLIIKDYNLNVTPGSAQFGKQSNEEGKILILTIDYEDTEYVVKIMKTEGTLELKEDAGASS